MTSSSRVARARSVLAALLAAAAGWMLGVAAWAAWFGVALARDNALSAREALAAVGVTWGVYLVAALPGLLAALVFLAPGLGRVSSRRAAGAGLAGSVAAVVVLNLLFRWAPAYKAVAPGHPSLVPMGVVDLVALGLGLVAIAAGGALAARGRRAGLAWLAVGGALLCAAHVANRVYEKPSRVDLTAAVTPHVPRDSACSARPGPASGLVVLALDGMTWNVAAPLLARGEMPNLARLLARSSYGHLESLEVSYSPVVWATLATGLPESEHRVHGFLRLRLPGVATPVSTAPRVNAFNWAGGANRLLAVLAALRWGSVEPLPQSQRRGLAIWDIAAGHGHRVGVYNWMNTWPVEQLPGYEYTSVGAPPATAYPLEEVLAVVAGAPREGPQFPDSKLAKYPHHYSEAFALWRHFAPSVSFHFNKAMDNMHDRWTDASYFVRPIPPGAQRFPEIVENSYTLTDWWIGRFLEATPPDRVLALVSDHGYEFNGTGHVFAPPGVIALSGGPFACRRLLEGAGVLDVVPTLLVALGIPPAETMPGHVLEAAFADGPPRVPPRVASYPDAWRRPEVAAAPGDDWEALRRRLEALGYAN